MSKLQVQVSVVGFCLVKESASESESHRVIAVDPSIRHEKHALMLSVKSGSISYITKKLADRLFSIGDDSIQIRFPPRVEFAFPEPNSRVSNWIPSPVRPASLSDLGSTGLRGGVGEGPLTRKELGRVDLPSTAEYSYNEWSGMLGMYQYKDRFFEDDVAHRFTWVGGYSSNVKINIYKNNRYWGSLVLSHRSGLINVTLGCNLLRPRSTRYRDAFGNVAQFRFVAKGTIRAPVLVHRDYMHLARSGGRIKPLSIGSASCPPIKVD